MKFTSISSGKQTTLSISARLSILLSAQNNFLKLYNLVNGCKMDKLFPDISNTSNVLLIAAREPCSNFKNSFRGILCRDTESTSNLVKSSSPLITLISFSSKYSFFSFVFVILGKVDITLFSKYKYDKFLAKSKFSISAILLSYKYKTLRATQMSRFSMMRNFFACKCKCVT